MVCFEGMGERFATQEKGGCHGWQEDPDVTAPGISPEYEELARRLRLEPYTFRFFQAVWLLERMQPGRMPVGEFGDPRREAVRFGVAAGAAAVMTPGTELCRRDDTERLFEQIMQRGSL